MKAARAQRGAMVRGGRYGDPGFFSFLGKAAKSVVGGALGFATGGIGGAIRGSGLISQPSAPSFPSFPQLPAGPGGGRGIAIPFASSAPAARGPNGNGMAGTKLACQSGYHPNKADYFLKDGTFVPAGTRCVKNRRRDPLNPRALRHAIGRVEAGKTWQAKLREIETGRYTKAGSRKD